MYLIKYEACLKLLCIKGYKSFSIFKTESQLKVRLRCKASHAEERAAFRSTICHASNPASAAPQNQLQLAKASLKKLRGAKWGWRIKVC